MDNGSELRTIRKNTRAITSSIWVSYMLVCLSISRLILDKSDANIFSIVSESGIVFDNVC